MLDLQTKPLGDWQANSYLLINPQTSHAILFDPGAEAQVILAWVNNVVVQQILITHGDPDHVGALETVRNALNIPFGIHPIDAEHFDIRGGFDLLDGAELELDEHRLEIVHIPGHTLGSVAFQVIEKGVFQRALVGDTIFPGGPGHTKSPEALALSLDSLASTVFTWPDDITLFPGHGDPTTVGAERADFNAFQAQPLPPDLYGDVTWRR